MKFSILIANYNNGSFFKDCYDSIIQQTYTTWEVIIVDDCSTDDSIEAIEKLIHGDERFRLYFNSKNVGCGYTKRRCMELATGELCGFVDPDDSIEMNALSLMVNAHIQYPDVSLIHSTFYYCDEFLKQKAQYEGAGPVEVSDQFTNLDGRVTAFASFKRHVYEQTEGIDPTLLRAVDQDLYLKISEKGKFHFIHKAVYNYRIHKNGIASVNDIKAFYCQLKVLALAELRRNVNLEDEVAKYLVPKSYRKEFEERFSNPRFLLSNVWKCFKKSPLQFVKKLY